MIQKYAPMYFHLSPQQRTSVLTHCLQVQATTGLSEELVYILDHLQVQYLLFMRATCGASEGHKHISTRLMQRGGNEGGGGETVVQLACKSKVDPSFCGCLESLVVTCSYVVRADSPPPTSLYNLIPLPISSIAPPSSHLPTHTHCTYR